MRFVFGLVATAGAVVGLGSLAAAVLPLPAGAVERFGIERAQAELRADVPSSEQRSKAAPKQHHRQPPPKARGNQDEGGEGSNAVPSPDVAPPGCLYRKAPLELIV